MKKKSIKAVFLDFDGTFIESLPHLYSTYIKLLRRYGYEGSEAEFQSLIGPSLKEVVEILRDKYSFPDTADKQLEYYRLEIDSYYREVAIPWIGALQFASKVKREGYTQYVVTSNQKVVIEAFLKRHDIEGLFDAVIGSEQVFRCKPDPEIYKLALKTAGAAPHEAIAIEDAVQGVQAAVGAGIYTIHLNTAAKETRHHSMSVEMRSWELIHDYFW